MVSITKWVGFSIATLSFCCTITTLLIIQRMKKWNGYLLLISTMTTFQLLYDINYMLGVCPGYIPCMIWNFLDIIGGLGNAYTSNVISYTVIFVVYRIQSFDIFANFYYILFLVGFIPLLFAILNTVSLQHQVDDDEPYEYCILNHSNLGKTTTEFYYWTRVASIIFNFIAFIYISVKVERMKSTVVHHQHHGSSFDTQESKTTGGYSTENQMAAIATIVSRLKYYPLAQAICRVGSAWNEWKRSSDYNPVSSMLAAVTAPLAGTFYFIIFIMMQPTARKTLTSILFCQKDTTIDQENDSNNNPIPSTSQHQQQALSKIFRPKSVDYYDESELDDIINRVVQNDRPISLLSVTWNSPPSDIIRDSDTSINPIIRSSDV